MTSNPRAIWKGAINFGLVNINVKLYAATQDNDTSFKQVHIHHGAPVGRINYKRICTECAEEVPYAEISKGYEDGNTLTILSAEDIKAIPLESAHVIDVQEFVPRSQVDDILLERTYTVTPEDTAVKAYTLLLAALSNTDKVGVVKVTLRQREQLAMLTVRSGRLSLTTLRWADEVREMPTPAYPESTEAEVALATTLIESLSQPGFSPANYQDGYRAALEKLIESKREGLVTEPVQPRKESNVVDLMAALRASIEAHQANKRTPRKRKVSA